MIAAVGDVWVVTGEALDSVKEIGLEVVNVSPDVWLKFGIVLLADGVIIVTDVWGLLLVASNDDALVVEMADEEAVNGNVGFSYVW